jgi:hypothetical protein
MFSLDDFDDGDELYELAFCEYCGNYLDECSCPFVDDDENEEA